MKDKDGLILTTERGETVLAYDSYAAAFLGGGPHQSAILAAAEADRDCVFVNAHAAAVHMALESAAGFRAAQRDLKRARKRAGSATPREQAFVAAVNDWWRGKPQVALARLRRIVTDRPADLVAAAWALYLALNLGDAKAMLAVAETAVEACGDSAAAWSMFAFARAQANDNAGAEVAARAALSRNPADPLAHYVLADAMRVHGRIDEAIAFLRRQAPTWADRATPVRQRNHWLLLLLQLERNEHAQALQLFDDMLWVERSDLAQSQIYAISALMNLELHGADVGGRWRPLVDKVLARWHEHLLPLNDLHFLYALARCDRRLEVREFLASMRRRGAADDSGIWESLAVPCAQGLAAHADGRFATAAELIAPVLPRLHLIGGRVAQRDVFQGIWRDAATRAGDRSALAA